MSDAIHLVPFETRHVDSLILRPEAAALLSGLGPLPQLARSYAAAGPAWTLTASGLPVACGGAVRFWPGVGELWCWAGVESGLLGVAFARQTLAALGGLLAQGGFHRLQAHVREDDERARRFVRFLGLRFEGRCPGYGPDKATYQLYGRY